MKKLTSFVSFFYVVCMFRLMKLTFKVDVMSKYLLLTTKRRLRLVCDVLDEAFVRQKPRYKNLLFCKYVDQTKFLRNFVCHNEPRYTYPAAYKTTDDLLHSY